MYTHVDCALHNDTQSLTTQNPTLTMCSRHPTLVQ